mgnify:CR=1 FL=1
MKLINNTIIGTLLLTMFFLATDTHATTNCSANANDLVFGSINMGAAQNSTATVTVNCNTFGLSLLANARVRMCLNIGSGSAAGSTVNSRVMSNISLDQLNFQIYRDASRSQIWGNTDTEDLDIDLQYAVPVLGGSGMVSATLYGRVPAQTNLSADNYQNPFTGSHTRLDYRYAEALLSTPNWPTSCTSGGNGGGSITFPFTASANVPGTCVIDSVNNLNFGTMPGLISSHIDQTTSLSFTCTNTTPWKVSLDDGLHVNGTSRRMHNSTSNSYLQYDLYSNSARNQRWGSTLDVDTVNNIGTGNSQSLTVYGRVPAIQAVPTGEYSDTVTVTITY